MKWKMDLAMVVGLGALFALGCGQPPNSGALETYALGGRVTFADGEPVVGARVAFSSTDNDHSVSALTNEHGEYKMSSSEGLPPGDYRVTIGTPVSDESGTPQVIVDPMYANKMTSGFIETIEPFQNVINFEVERHAGSEPEAESAETTRATMWMGQTLWSRNGIRIGEVENMVFDFAANRAVILAVKPRADELTESTDGVLTLLPPAMVWTNDTRRLEADISAKQFAQLPYVPADIVQDPQDWGELSGIFAERAAVFGPFLEAGYWNRDSQAPTLQSFRSLVQTAVHSNEGADVARIADVILAKVDATITSIVVKRRDEGVHSGQLQAIPLDAFLHESKSDAWRLQWPMEKLNALPHLGWLGPNSPASLPKPLLEALARLGFR